MARGSVRSSKGVPVRASIFRLAAIVACVAAVLAPASERAGATARPRTAITLPTVFQGYGASNLADVTCPTSELCLAVGDEGPVISSEYSLLYRSTDGGVTWLTMPVPGGTLGNNYDWEEASVAVSCGSPSFCVLEYVGGGDFESDFFEVSTDGGTTWSSPYSSNLEVNEGQVGMTSLTCVAAGACLGIFGGKLASTTNGVASWVVHSGPDDIVSLSCPTATRCYVLETSSAKGIDSLVVARTTNLGATLTPVLTIHSSGWTVPPALACSTTLACRVLVPDSWYPHLLFTTNGGRTWGSQGAPETSAQRVEAFDCTSPADCVFLVPDPSSATKVDSFSTTDGGKDWGDATVWVLAFRSAVPALWCHGTECKATLGTRSVFSLDLASPEVTAWTGSQVSVPTPPLELIACESGGSCLALGPGVTATSPDDGASWSETSDKALDGDVITSLTCPLASTCFAAGYSGDEAAPTGLVLATTDLGADWTAATLPWEVGEASDVQCNSLGTCLALPGFVSGLTHVPTFVLRGTDGGVDWSLVQLAPASAHLSLTGVACPTTNCLAVGAEAGVASVETSNDGGATWTGVDPTAGGFGGLAGFDGLACTSVSGCETTALSDFGAEVDAWGTANAGGTWSKLGTMLTVPKAGYWGAAPTMSWCSSGVCAALSHNVVGPERPAYYDTIAASDSSGAAWDTDEPFASVASVTVAPNGSVIAVAMNPEGGPTVFAGSG
jgi:hypothetical protein